MIHELSCSFQINKLNEKTDFLSQPESNLIETLLSNKRERSDENRYLCKQCNGLLTSNKSLFSFSNEFKNYYMKDILKDESNGSFYLNFPQFTLLHVELCNECLLKNILSNSIESLNGNKELFQTESFQSTKLSNPNDIIGHLLTLFQMLLQLIQSFDRNKINIIQESLETSTKVKYKLMLNSNYNKLKNQKIINVTKDINTTETNMIELYTQLIEQIDFYQSILNVFNHFASYSQKIEKNTYLSKELKKICIENNYSTNYSTQELMANIRYLINPSINDILCSLGINQYQSMEHIKKRNSSINTRNMTDTQFNHQKQAFPYCYPQSNNNQFQQLYPNYFNTSLDHYQLFSENFSKVKKDNNKLSSVFLNNNLNQYLPNHIQLKPINNSLDLNDNVTPTSKRSNNETSNQTNKSQSLIVKMFNEIAKNKSS